MNIENKKTALDDEAALYKHETDALSEKEKLKNMTGAQKWQHFKQYYLLKVVLAVAGAGILISILVSIFKPQKEEVLYACIFNGCISRDAVDKLSAEFEESLELDTDKYKTTFDQDYMYNSPYSEASQRFAMMANTGKATVAVMPESVFLSFAAHRYFEKIDEVLTDEELTPYRDLLAYSSLLDEKDKEMEGSKAAYGIVIDTCPTISQNPYKEPVVFVIVAGKKSDKYAKEFLKFLFANK